MIPASVKIFVCTEPQDMRRSFDGLARAAREVLDVNPQSGALLCFFNKRRNRLKVLWWDSSGYTLLYKRAHEVRFEPPVGDAAGGVKVVVDGRGLAALLRGVPKPPRKRRIQRKGVLT